MQHEIIIDGEEYIKKSSPESPDSPTAKVMNVKEVAEYLKLSQSTIYFMKQERKIPFIKIGGALRFQLDDIDKWLLSKSHTQIMETNPNDESLHVSHLDFTAKHFFNVISQIKKNGYTISEALKKIGISKPKFYKGITIEQKQSIKRHRDCYGKTKPLLYSDKRKQLKQNYEQQGKV